MAKLANLLVWPALLALVTLISLSVSEAQCEPQSSNNNQSTSEPTSSTGHAGHSRTSTATRQYRARHSTSRKSNKSSSEFFNYQRELSNLLGYNNTPPYWITHTRDFLIDLGQHEPGDKLFHLLAIDGENDTLHYTLRPAPAPDASAYLAVDSGTANIRLRADAGPDTSGQLKPGLYHLNVEASDSRYPSILELQVYMFNSSDMLAEDWSELRAQMSAGQSEASFRNKTDQLYGSIIRSLNSAGPSVSPNLVLPNYVNPGLVLASPQQPDTVDSALGQDTHVDPSANPNLASYAHSPQSAPLVEPPKVAHFSVLQTTAQLKSRTTATTTTRPPIQQLVITAEPPPQDRLVGPVEQPALLGLVAVLSGTLVVALVLLLFVVPMSVRKLRQRLKVVENRHEQLSQQNSHASSIMTDTCTIGNHHLPLHCDTQLITPDHQPYQHAHYKENLQIYDSIEGDEDGLYSTLQPVITNLVSTTCSLAHTAPSTPFSRSGACTIARSTQVALEQTNKWELDRHRLKFLEILDTGQFGLVWRCKLRQRRSDITVAVKTIRNSTQLANQDQARQELLKEIDIMKSLGTHPNVVRLLHCCTCDSHSTQRPVLLVMEYAELGKLQSYLRNSRLSHSYGTARNHSPSETSGSDLSAQSQLVARDLLKFIYHVAQGMEHISSLCILHRDLASRNILLSVDRICKIGDFGMARKVGSPSGCSDEQDLTYQRSRDAKVPVRWMAPEVIISNQFTTSSDVYSFGVLMWEIVTLGSTPYTHLKTDQVIEEVAKKGERPEKPEYCHEQLYRIMSQCWSQKPTDRPIFRELITRLDQLLMSGEEYIQLDQYPDHDYYNIPQAALPYEII